MNLTTCPHCGAEVVGAKIKCSACGKLLNAPAPRGESPDENVIFRGQDARDEATARDRAPLADSFSVDTSSRRVANITERVAAFVLAIGESGLVHVFVPHATAGIALMETGSGSEADLGEALDRLFPPDDRYAHQHGTRGHGRSHVVPVFVAPFATIPVDDGELLLGEWQSIVVVDVNEDNGERRVLLSFIPGRR